MIATREIEIEREKDKKRDREGRGGRTRARQRKKKLKPAAERSGRNRILRDNLIASATIEADEADEGIGYSLASTTWQLSAPRARILLARIINYLHVDCARKMIDSVKKTFRRGLSCHVRMCIPEKYASSCTSSMRIT